jgi:hypothetical protein
MKPPAGSVWCGRAATRGARWLLVVGLAGGLGGGLAGCLEREESVEVRADGSAAWAVRFAGKAREFNKPLDALPGVSPSAGAGWGLAVSGSLDGHPESEVEIRGERVIADFASMPDRFEQDPASPAYEAGLKFPTRVWTELRGDGLYYHFRRVYREREHRRFNWPRERLAKNESLQKLLKQDQATWTDQQRGELVDALVSVELARQLELIAAAAEDMGADWPQDWGLRLRNAAERYAAGAVVNRERTLELLKLPATVERDAALATLGQDLVAGFVPALRAELAELGVGDTESRVYLDHLGRRSNRLSVTEDLGDEVFRVRVRLPGELVAHNGQSVEAGWVVFEFSGESLQDRDADLRVTSRVVMVPGGAGGGGAAGQ